MNALRNHWTGNWAAVFALFSLIAALSCDAANTATVTVQVQGGGTVTPNYNGQALTAGNQYSLTAKPKPGFVFTGWTGSLTNSATKISFVLSSDMAFTASFVDTQAPTVSIMPVPKSWATNSVGNPVYTVTGTAKDNGTIVQVFCSVNGGAWQNAATGNGWKNWWANLTLVPNTNTILAYAVDSDGNTSKTAKLNVIYSAAQPNFYQPHKLTMLVNHLGDIVEVATFLTNTFSDITGVGTYTYKKTGPVNGKLTMKYTAPPSAVNATNNVNVTLLYDTYYAGRFSDADGLNTFLLTDTANWAPATLTGSKLFLTDSDGSTQTKLDFPNQPALGANADLQKAPNPVVLTLSAAYPGQLGDRVNVTFDHKRKQNGTVKTLSTPVDVGTVIETNGSTIKILFDSPAYSKSDDMFSPVGISTISYYYQNLTDGTVVTNGTGTFNFTNYTWVGALLQLNQAGQKKSVILTFTNETTSGIYYDESLLPDSTQVTDSGSFELALPPQITSQPQDFATTNGGTGSFSVIVGGTPVLVYQWQFNGIPLTDGPTGNGSTIAGSATTNLTVTGVTLSDFGNYQVVITNDYGSVTSSIARLTLAVPPSISVQPQNVSTTSGGSTSFSVTAAGSQPLSYQWQFNGANLSNKTNAWNSVVQGATTATLGLSSLSVNDTGFYQVIITNNFGAVTSSIANLNVSP